MNPKHPLAAVVYRFFRLDEHGSNIRTELVAGFTTYVSMAYIIVLNPAILAKAGMDSGAVFTATILSTVIATLIMGLYANVPFAQAPGMGLNAFFTFSVVAVMGYSWQQALAVVFCCGVLNFVIVVTKVRKELIRAIPQSLQHAIGGGIGLFIAYIGLKNAHFMDFIIQGPDMLHQQLIDGQLVEVVAKNAVPTLANFSDPITYTALLGLVLTAALMLWRIKGAIVLGMLVTTLIGLATGVTAVPSFSTQSFLPPSLSPTFFSLDLTGLFAPDRLSTTLSLILSFSLADTFDTIGTFIGTGQKAKIFDSDDISALKGGRGFSSKLDRALFSDGIATSLGALLGTSNVTSYIESASGIAAGGRTGLTSVFVAVFFLLSLFVAPLAGMIPASATAAALVVVGVLMMESMINIRWQEFEEALPAFLTAILMPLSFSIANGIAAGFVFFLLTKLFLGKFREVHPLLLIVTGLFLANFVLNAVS